MADKQNDSVAPLEGKTTIDAQMFFEPERLSYLSALAVAERLASAVVGEIDKSAVVIADERLLADFANLQAVFIRLDNLTKEYDSLKQLTKVIRAKRTAELTESAAEIHFAQPHVNLATAFSVAINPIGAALEAAIGLIGFFREDVEYRGAKTVLDALAFEITLGARLLDKGASAVFIPDLMVLNKPQTGEGSLSDRLNKVQQARTEAWESVGPLVAQLVRLEASLDLAARDKDQERVNELTRQVSDLRRDMQPISDPLSRTDQTLSELQNQLTQTDETKVSILGRLLRAEVIQSKEPIYLNARVVSSGGHHRISRNLFRMLFLGDGLSFAGGVIVRWALLRSDGSLKKGGILTERRSSPSWFALEDGV